MRKLVLYSDQQVGVSDELDAKLLELLCETKGKIGIIPSETDRNLRYFKRTSGHYEDLGLNNFMHFDAGQEFDASLIPQLLKCDAIHLSGGETSPFLMNLKNHGMLPVLSKYVQNGGVLIGVSAGAMLMCPSIDICNAVADENTMIQNAKKKRKEAPKTKEKSVSAMNLVSFEFFPHYENSDFTNHQIQSYVNKVRRNVIASDDSQGVVILGEEIFLMGEPTVFTPR